MLQRLKKLLFQKHDVVRVTGHVRFTVRNADGSIAQVEENHNIETTVGMAVIANALWNPSAAPRVTHVELGSGTNAATAGDTALQTPVYRNALASGNNVSNVVSLTGYYNLTETSGTFREAGLFIAGTGTLGTGTLLARTAMNVTKTTSQTLTVEWAITFTPT